jgi:hypothetical protein
MVATGLGDTNVSLRGFNHGAKQADEKIGLAVESLTAFPWLKEQIAG